MPVSRPGSVESPTKRVYAQDEAPPVTLRWRDLSCLLAVKDKDSKTTSQKTILSLSGAAARPGRCLCGGFSRRSMRMGASCFSWRISSSASRGGPHAVACKISWIRNVPAVVTEEHLADVWVAPNGQISPKSWQCRWLPADTCFSTLRVHVQRQVES